jgi:hypothetical protein
VKLLPPNNMCTQPYKCAHTVATDRLSRSTAWWPCARHVRAVKLSVLPMLHVGNPLCAPNSCGLAAPHAPRPRDRPSFSPALFAVLIQVAKLSLGLQAPCATLCRATSRSATSDHRTTASRQSKQACMEDISSTLLQCTVCPPSTANLPPPRQCCLTRMCQAHCFPLPPCAVAAGVRAPCSTTSTRKRRPASR